MLKRLAKMRKIDIIVFVNKKEVLMNKEELVKEVAKKAKVSQKAAADVLALAVTLKQVLQLKSLLKQFLLSQLVKNSKKLLSSFFRFNKEESLVNPEALFYWQLILQSTQNVRYAQNIIVYNFI